MVSPDASNSQYSMAKHAHALRQRAYHCFSDGCLFLGGAFMALLLVWSFSSFASPATNLDEGQTLAAATAERRVSTGKPCSEGAHGANARLPESRDREGERNFYDDPKLSYSIEKPVKDWDEKRRDWLRQHPSQAAGARDRVLLVTGSQPSPCKNKIGDHLLLRLFKNKVDYCRLHGCDVFYNNVLLHPKMHGYWAKYAIVRAAMLAHPEAEWIWWVDSDALFTDMDFSLPLERYAAHNLVVHGWPHLIYEKKSWTSLNAGVFLIRNCQWSMDFMEVWTRSGPQSPDYEEWGRTLRATLPDKMFPESDDQSTLVYLLLKHREEYGDKVYLESEYNFEGYWVELLPTLDNITRSREEVERAVPVLRRRHAERASAYYARRWAEEEVKRGEGSGGGEFRRRPFVTHFTGCEPCSGAHNEMYSAESCWDGMVKALNFADNQVLRRYSYLRPDLLDSAAVKPVPFDYPVAPLDVRS